MSDMKCKSSCMCPWKMCMCHIKSMPLALAAMTTLNFAFLYIVHVVVMHFAAGHAHAHLIYLGIAALLGALIMAMHKRCMCCNDKKD